jgi:hypothetical protein
VKTTVICRKLSWGRKRLKRQVKARVKLPFCFINHDAMKADVEVAV